MTDKSAKRFVSLCLEMRWSTSAEERARQLAQESDLDWNAVRRVVDAEQLAPFLYHSTHSRHLFPKDLERDFSIIYYQTAAQNALRLKDLEQLLSQLRQQSISVILLKGAAHIETLYRDAPVRPMDDIDLMVRPESLATAIQVLSRFCGSPAGSGNQTHAVIEYAQEITFRKAAKADTVFDLHWQALDSPFYPHKLFTNWLWDSSMACQVGSMPARVLGREALLLHLCGHYLVDESRKELLWLYDIAYTIAKYRDAIDWDLVIAQAQTYCLVCALQRAVSQVGNEWMTVVPREVQERVDRLTSSPAEVALYDWANSKDRATVRLVKVNLASMGSWLERGQYIARNLFPPVSYMKYRYGIRNTFWVLLAYPYRWLLSSYRAVIH
jgi:Uncharacterised nucleotidyltransferase